LKPDRDRDAHGDAHAVAGQDASGVEQVAGRIPEIA